MLRYHRIRDNKIKLLYGLNVFRAIQKRLTLDLREMATRDRILGDCNITGALEKTKDEDYEENDA